MSTSIEYELIVYMRLIIYVIVTVKIELSVIKFIRIEPKTAGKV